MTYAPPVVHLFIGLHKTGTTSIRFMLEVHRASFERYGFHIPRATWTTCVHDYWNGGHNNIPWEICRNQPRLPEYGTVADLVRELKELPEKQHILLSEDLDIASLEHVQQLREAFAGLDVRVVVFLRNQVDWVQANFAEDQKWYGAKSFKDWCRGRVGRDDRLDLHALCVRWAEAFGTVTIRCYEDIRSRLFDAFLECCEVPTELRQELGRRGIPIINATPGEFPLALIRHASEHAEANRIEPAFFNAVIGSAATAAAAHLGRFSARRSVMTAEVAEELFPLMRTSNRALADRFGLSLGPSYMDPAVPDEPGDVEAAPLSIDELAQCLVAAATDTGYKAAARIRQAAIVEGGSPVRRLAQRYYPWQPRPEAATPLLDEIIGCASSVDGTSLYLERQGEVRAAYRLAAGTITLIRPLNELEWNAVISAIEYRAALSPVSGFDLRQGSLEYTRNGTPTFLTTRHARTSNGEIATLEDRQHGHPAAAGAAACGTAK